MERTKGTVIGLIVLGAILLLLPAQGIAGPVLPGEPVGTHVTCKPGVTIGSKLGSPQPLRPHGTCPEILSISDTRVNITIIGDGGNVFDFGGSACAANAGITTILTNDPSAAEIVQVRGKNIIITALNIVGLRGDDPSINPPLDPTVFPNTGAGSCVTLHGAPGPSPGAAGDPDAQDGACSNNRGVRAQRQGGMQIGRNTRDSSILKLADPSIYFERTGVCIFDVGSQGIEVTQQSFARVVNSEVRNVGGVGIQMAEGSAAFIGSTSGGEYKLTTDSFRGPGFSGANLVHDNSGAGIQVDRLSEARIVGNYVHNNGGNGMTVSKNSHADIDSNLIESNTGSGVTVSDNSNVSLGTTWNAGCASTSFGSPCGTGTFDPRTLANTTRLGFENASFGVKCTVGGSISGKLTTDRGGGGIATSTSGPLKGLGGAKYTTSGLGTASDDKCVDLTK